MIVRPTSNALQLRVLDLLLPAALLIYLVVLSCALSPEHMMWGDELLAWNLLADPSWTHAYHAWLGGADGGGITYYVFGRSVLAVFGHSHTVMRAYSAACLGLGATVWYRLLRSYYSRWAVSLGIGVVWLCNRTFLDQAFQVRFYGQFVLAFALVVYGLVWMERRNASCLCRLLIAFTGTALLVHTHMLGVFYSGLLLLAILLGRSSVRSKSYQTAGILLGWTSLLPFVHAFQASAHMQQWIQMPSLRNVVQHYVHTPVSLPGSVLGTDVLNLAFLSGALLALWLRGLEMIRVRKGPDYRTFALISGAILLAPVGLYVASHIGGKPVFTERYIMPEIVCMATVIAFAADRLLPKVSGVIRSVCAVLAVSAIAFLHVVTVRDIRKAVFQPYSYLTPLLAMPGSEPVLVFDVPLAQQILVHAGSRRFFRFADPTLLALEYAPMFVPDSVFLERYSTFLYIDNEAGKRAYRELHETFMNDPRWHVEHAGSVEVKGIVAPVYRLQRVSR